MSAAIAFRWVLNPSNAERRLSPLTHNRCGFPVHFRSPSFFGLGSLAHLMWTTGITGLKVNGCAFFRFQRGAKGRGAAPCGTAPGSLLSCAKRYGVSFSKQLEDHDLVNYSDVQSLPDLTCYITLPGQYPVIKQAMKYEKIKPVAAEFTPRPINDSLDQEIEAQIESRLKLDAIPESVNAALDGLISGNPVESAAIAVAEPTASPENSAIPSVAFNIPNPSDAVSGVADSTPASSAESTTSTGREIEMNHLLVDTDTGEILDPQTHLEENPQDTYDNYCRMRQEEKEILVKQLPQSREAISNDEHEHEHEDSRSW